MVTNATPSITCGVMSWRDKLRISRERAGMSQDELGKAVGVSGSAINLWENGPTYPSVKNLLKASEECDFDLSWIFSSEPDEYPSDSARAAKAAFSAYIRAHGADKTLERLISAVDLQSLSEMNVREWLQFRDLEAVIQKMKKSPAELQITSESSPTTPQPRRRRKRAGGPKQLPAPSRSDKDLDRKDKGSDR